MRSKFTMVPIKLTPHDITEILLKVALNIINLNLILHFGKTPFPCKPQGVGASYVQSYTYNFKKVRNIFSRRCMMQDSR